MASSQPTLSLADVAKLAGVQRPVVSMWRKRVIRNQPFPSADDDGRFVDEWHSNAAIFDSLPSGLFA